MAENEETTGAGGGNGGDASESAAAAATAAPPAESTPAAEGPRLRLAHHPVKRVAIPDTDRTEPKLREPATAEGLANIYGLPPIYFPALEAQAQGFTPYFVAKRAGKPTAPQYDARVREREADLEGRDVTPLDLQTVTLASLEEDKPGERVEIDLASGAAAARAVLKQFGGIYKPVEVKGE